MTPPDVSTRPSPGAPRAPWRLTRPSFVRRLQRLLQRHRRALAALAAGLAMAAAVGAASPPAPPTRSVVVAARTIAPGAALAADDLRVAAYPVGLVPGGAVTDPGAVVGRTTTTGLSPGSPLTAAAVVSSGGTRAAPGRSLVPVRLADAALVQVVRVGDRVDVLALGGEGQPPRVVARGARVAAIPDRAGDSGPLSADTSGGPTLLFDVDADAAPPLAQAAVTNRLGIVLRP